MIARIPTDKPLKEPPVPKTSGSFDYSVSISRLQRCRDVLRHVDAAGGRMGQRVRDTAAVADDVQAFVLCHQVLIQLDFHIVNTS